MIGLVVMPLIRGYAVLQHYVLHFLLWRNGFAPLRYVRFLDHAAELLFLRKTGGGYAFVHRMIMEHFAELRVSDFLNAKQKKHCLKLSYIVAIKEEYNDDRKFSYHSKN